MSELKNITDAAKELNTTRQSIYAWADGVILNYQFIGNTKYIVVDEKYLKLKTKREKS